MAKELFKLFGMIGMHGVEDVEKGLKKIDRQARKAQREIDKFGRGVTEAGKKLTVGFTVPLLAMSAAVVKGIDHAVDLNETMSKTDQIFGESSETIKEWSKTTSTAIGQSQTEAMEAASTFGIFGKAAGLAGEDLANFSTEFVELASDMASFFNTSPEDAVNAIGSAFRGEAEPMRRYGVLLDDASMRQKAFELGIVDSIKHALTPQNKILAAQALILEKTKDAQGDFAKTSDGLANQQRILAAEIKNVSTSLGTIFLPLATKAMSVIRTGLVPAIKGAVEWFQELDDSMQKTIMQWLGLAAAIGPVVIVVGKFISASKVLIPIYTALTTRQWSLNAAMAANPIGAVITGLVALSAAGIYLYNNWEKVDRFLDGFFENLFWNAKITSAKVQLFFDEMLESVLGGLSDLADWIPGLGDAVDEMYEKVKAGNDWDAELIKGYERAQKASNDLREKEAALAATKDEVTRSTEKELKAIQDAIEAKTKSAQQLEEEKRKLKELAERRANLEEDYKTKLFETHATKLELLQKEKEEALAEAEATGAEKFEIFAYYRVKEEELQQEIRDKVIEQDEEDDARKEEAHQKQMKRLKDEKRGRINVMNAISGGARKIERISGKFSSNALKRIEIQKNRDIERIQASTMSEEQKATAIENIEVKAEARSEKLRKKQARREKAFALFQIAINTASAVAEALPNIPLSIAVGALGAAEAVAVAQQPTEFFDGGLIQGSADGVNAIVGEKDQTELVFPLETGVDMLFNKLMDRINTVELPGAGGAVEPELATEGGPAISLNIGNFFGDKKSMKDLYRKLNTIGISENQRKGLI